MVFCHHECIAMIKCLLFFAASCMQCTCNPQHICWGGWSGCMFYMFIISVKTCSS